MTEDEAFWDVVERAKKRPGAGGPCGIGVLTDEDLIEIGKIRGRKPMETLWRLGVVTEANRHLFAEGIVKGLASHPDQGWLAWPGCPGYKWQLPFG